MPNLLEMVDILRERPENMLALRHQCSPGEVLIPRTDARPHTPVYFIARAGWLGNPRRTVYRTDVFDNEHNLLGYIKPFGVRSYGVYMIGLDGEPRYVGDIGSQTDARHCFYKP